MRLLIAISTISDSSIVNKMRILKAIIFGKSDVRNTNESAPYGIDSNPIAGMNAIYAETCTNGKPVIIGYVNKQQLAAIGENRSFATDSSGALKFNIWQRADGTCLIGTSDTPSVYTDNLVRYEKLNLALTNYINELNIAIGTGIAGAGGTYTPPVSPLDISLAKITELKVQPS